MIPTPSGAKRFIADLQPSSRGFVSEDGDRFEANLNNNAHLACVVVQIPGLRGNDHILGTDGRQTD